MLIDVVGGAGTRASRRFERGSVRATGQEVMASRYGGEITRKGKCLEKQKEGKKRMRRVGRVDVPREAFIAALRVDKDAAGDRK